MLLSLHDLGPGEIHGCALDAADWPGPNITCAELVIAEPVGSTNFGRSLVVGDFNDDGFEDLAAARASKPTGRLRATCSATPAPPVISTATTSTRTIPTFAATATATA